MAGERSLDHPRSGANDCVPRRAWSGRYRGEVVIKRRDFGIEPIKVAGGAVKVKDDIRVQFEIAR
jgi:hypothetical protein